MLVSLSCFVSCVLGPPPAGGSPLSSSSESESTERSPDPEGRREPHVTPRHRGSANPWHWGQGTGSLLLVELGPALP